MILVVLGMMNPLVIVGVTLVIAAEKILPRPELTARLVGLAAIIAGPVPIIALALLQHYQSSLPIGVMLMVYAVVSFISAALVRDRSKQDLTAEYDERGGEREVQPTPSRVMTR